MSEAFTQINPFAMSGEGKTEVVALAASAFVRVVSALLASDTPLPAFIIALSKSYVSVLQD